MSWVHRGAGLYIAVTNEPAVSKNVTEAKKRPKTAWYSNWRDTYGGTAALQQNFLPHKQSLVWVIECRHRLVKICRAEASASPLNHPRSAETLCALLLSYSHFFAVFMSVWASTLRKWACGPQPIRACREWMVWGQTLGYKLSNQGTWLSLSLSSAPLSWIHKKLKVCIRVCLTFACLYTKSSNAALSCRVVQSVWTYLFVL